MTVEASAEDAWRSLAGCRVLLPSSCGFPEDFVKALAAVAGDDSYQLVVGLAFRGFEFLADLPDTVTATTWQYSPSGAGRERVSYLPIRYSQIISTFDPQGGHPVDALVLHLSPPDSEGFCSFGVSPSYLAAMTQRVPRLIGIVNPQMPDTSGHRRVHVDELEQIVKFDAPLNEFGRAKAADVDDQIARHLASLIEDGSTLQIGLGSIPEALPQALSGHRDLGLYGMLTDGGMELMTAGVVTGSRYTPAPGAVEVGEAVGSRRLFDFVDHNRAVRMVSADYAMDAKTFASVPQLVAVNSAIEVDLSGQVNAETIGRRIVSGAGGQCDYMQGAMLSPGGKSVIAFRSTAKNGASRIVHSLAAGSVVTTPRTAVTHVVTEHGIAALNGRTLEQRVEAIAAVAAPEHRERLLAQYREVTR